MEPIEKKLEQYKNEFGKPYPIYMPLTKSPEEIAKEIDECLRTGKPAPQRQYEDENLFY